MKDERSRDESLTLSRFRLISTISECVSSSRLFTGSSVTLMHDQFIAISTATSGERDICVASIAKVCRQRVYKSN